MREREIEINQETIEEFAFIDMWKNIFGDPGW
jgi:hypothetical protein